jgi:hypothetical protein
MQLAAQVFSCIDPDIQRLDGASLGGERDTQTAIAHSHGSNLQGGDVNRIGGSFFKKRRELCRTHWAAKCAPREVYARYQKHADTRGDKPPTLSSILRCRGFRRHGSRYGQQRLNLGFWKAQPS